MIQYADGCWVNKNHIINAFMRNVEDKRELVLQLVENGELYVRDLWVGHVMTELGMVKA